MHLQAEEVIRRLRAKDERVTKCFFFWKGPVLKKVEKIGGSIVKIWDREPICDPCRPALLTTLHSIYSSYRFSYEEKVSDLYMDLIPNDRFATIEKPAALIGWTCTVARNFFRRNKKKEDELASQQISLDSPSGAYLDKAVDIDTEEIRQVITEVLAAMPNHRYSQILNDVTLECLQYKGKEKTETRKRLAQQLNYSVSTLSVVEKRAKDMFRATLEKSLEK